MLARDGASEAASLQQELDRARATEGRLRDEISQLEGKREGAGQLSFLQC